MSSLTESVDTVPGPMEVLKSLKSRKIKVRQPKDLLPVLEGVRLAEQEYMIAFVLDGNNKLTGSFVVSIGLANQCQIHPREVFKFAIRNNGISVMVAHNHPSGNLEASESDLAATRRLSEAGKLLGIPLLDHLIVSEEGYLSIRERFPACF